MGRHADEADNQQMSARRVLLAPVESAGVAGAIRDGLRARGVQADLWTITPHPFVETEDRLLTGYLARARAGLIAPLRYDVLHFQFGTTLLEFVDAAWGKLAGRPLMLMHYWGSDCRPRIAAGLRPIGAPAEWEDQQRAYERMLRRRLRLASRLCAAAIVSDLELASYVKPWFKTVYVVPTPITLPLLPGPSLPPLPGEGPVVVHAPSNHLIKGTKTIEAAITAVAATRPLRPVLVSGVRHEQVLAEIERADIVIDQLNSLTTGILALEAMALGKPVLSQYDPSMLAPWARSTPVVAVTAQTLQAQLAALCDDPQRRASLASQGPGFVRSLHGADVVAGLLESVYADKGRAAGVFDVTVDGIKALDEPIGSLVE